MRVNKYLKMARYTDALRPDFMMSMLEENLLAIEEYARNGNLEEQQAAQGMLDFYYQHKDDMIP